MTKVDSLDLELKLNRLASRYGDNRLIRANFYPRRKYFQTYQGPVGYTAWYRDMPVKHKIVSQASMKLV